MRRIRRRAFRVSMAAALLACAGLLAPVAAADIAKPATESAVAVRPVNAHSKEQRPGRASREP